MLSADAFLMAVPKRTQIALILATVLVMIWQCLPNVPRAYADFSTVAGLSWVRQQDAFGTDTIADSYEAKVVLHNPLDMYTKRGLEQTPQEAATWTTEASAPYPPAVLLAEAGLYAAGEWTRIGFYGLVLLLAALFIGGSAWYFVETRWYVFPLLYLNFSYFGHRFVYVQDGSYLVMLVVILAALFLARAGRTACHALMAVAITMKLSPLYYVKTLPLMSRRMAWLFAGILVAGLIVPYFIWDNYLYIYVFHDELKGGPSGMISGLGLGAIFSALLWYVETRRGFDLEDRIGWALVPFGMFLAMKMNVPRHLLILLLVPDKRGVRNLIAAFALLPPVLFPNAVRFGAALPIATVLLFGVLAWHLRAIGWKTINDDVRHPGRTLRMLWSGASATSPRLPTT
jgi:hypothetical protein